MNERMRIGILALQGDFAEHKSIIESCGADTLLVKHAHQLNDVDALIIPGGESTTIAKLTGDIATTLFDTITEKARQGMPIYGTCMGTIFLAKQIEGSTQGRLALMDITVKRNAFGPQKFSREEQVSIPALGTAPFPVIFIRGPIITKCGTNVQELARVREGIVMARQGNLLATAFHPELTEDTRVHQYFLAIVREHSAAQRATQSATLSACSA